MTWSARWAVAILGPLFLLVAFLAGPGGSAGASAAAIAGRRLGYAGPHRRLGCARPHRRLGYAGPARRVRHLELPLAQPGPADQQARVDAAGPDDPGQ